MRRLLLAILMVAPALASAQPVGPYPASNPLGYIPASRLPGAATQTTPGLVASGAAGRSTLGVPPLTTATRTPATTDDTTASFTAGAMWNALGNIYQLQDSTTGAAMWQPITSAALPLDVVGLYVSAAAVSAGGASYVAGDTITLSGGAVLTVATVSSGAVATVTITTPNMHACAPTNPAAALATSGSGTGATFTLALLKPSGYGTRKMTRCYSGNAMTATRSDSSETLAVSFLPSGALDTQALDSFAAGAAPMTSYATYASGVSPRISIWNDQGGGANDATQTTAALRPTMLGSRFTGNGSRTVMFDAHGNTGVWDPASTYLNLPSGVSVARNNFSAFAVAGTETYGLKPVGYVFIGALNGGGSNITMGFHQNNGFDCANIATPTVGLSNPSDAPEIMGCVANSSGTTADIGNTSNTSSTVGGTQTVNTGALGSNSSTSSGTGLLDEAAAIIVPWAVSTATRQAVEASLAQTFGVATQDAGRIVFCCDSHTDGYGSTYQQSWPRQMAAMLGRTDIAIFNGAAEGAQLSNLIGNSTYYAEKVTPVFSSSTSPNRYLVLMGGYNDFATGSQTVPQVETTYANAAASTHALGAKVICATDIIKNIASSYQTQMAQLATYLRTTPSVCDGVIDFEATAVFDQPTGPWSLPWWEQQDSGQHASSAGQALMAEIAATYFRSVIQ